MKIHSITPYSYVNGPGKRTVIHFQGCHLNCPNCFNRETHSFNDGLSFSIEEIIKKIPKDIEGITISGGEPFLQSKELLALIKKLSKLTKSIIVFSGFYLKEIKKIKEGKEILNFIDVLIDGRFETEKISNNNLKGSENQTIHFLSSKHTEKEFQERNTEITFDTNGNIHITGFPEENLLNILK